MGLVRHSETRRLQIAMDDPLIMRGFESHSDLFRDRECLAVNQFENEKHLAVRFVEAVDRADVRMVQRRKYLRFTAEASNALGIMLETGRAGSSARRRDRGSCRARDTAHPCRPRLGRRGFRTS
jgi:hypothetical protein